MKKGDDGWDERRKAQEEEYFMKQNKKALARISERSDEKPRLSPITGEPMEQLTVMGVVIDRCNTSKGIWLDAGELEEIIAFSKKTEDDDDSEGRVNRFFKAVFNT